MMKFMLSKTTLAKMARSAGHTPQTLEIFLNRAGIKTSIHRVHRQLAGKTRMTAAELRFMADLLGATEFELQRPNETIQRRNTRV